MAYFVPRVVFGRSVYTQPLQRTAIIMEHVEDKIRSMIESHLQKTGAYLISAANPSPAHTYRYRLYVLPDIGPWPLLPNGWRIIRWRFLPWYMNIADLQAATANVMGIKGWDKLFFPIPRAQMKGLVNSNRPETKGMSKFRERLCSEHCYLWQAELDWFIPDQLDRERYIDLCVFANPFDSFGGTTFGYMTCRPKLTEMNLSRKRLHGNEAYSDVDALPDGGGETSRHMKKRKRPVYRELPVEAVLADMQKERRAACA